MSIMHGVTACTIAYQASNKVVKTLGLHLMTAVLPNLLLPRLIKCTFSNTDLMQLHRCPALESRFLANNWLVSRQSLIQLAKAMPQLLVLQAHG